MADEQFMTTEEVLDYLQVNIRTVYRLVKAGDIPAVRVGRQWRFRKRDIDAWLSARHSNRGPGEAPVASGTPARILVVDDEQTVRDLLSKVLSMAHYDVEAVDGGPAALERLKTTTCDLIITDLRMPGMDGLSMIREVRRLAAGVPILIITGYSTEASAIEALNLGVNGYVTKPFRLQKILAAVARALGEPLPAAP